MSKKLNTQIIKERISKLHNNEYELLSEYLGSNKPIKILHKKCNTEYIVKSCKSFTNENGSLCPKCNKPIRKSNKKVSLEEFLIRLKNQVNNEYIYISGYENNHSKIKLIHNKCNNFIETTPHMFLGSKQRRCKFCSNKYSRGKYAIKKNYLNNLLEEKDYGKEYEWLEDYKNNNKIPLEILHKKCNNKFFIRPNDFQQGYQCPYCNNIKTSIEEKELLNFIKENYNKKIIENYKDNRKEIDIYLPDLNIGFEYNGFYWHSDKYKDKNYHLDKLNYFKEKNIDIYFIDSLDWLNKKEIIKSKILTLINCNKNPSIYARNTEVKINIPFNIKKDFLNKNHIQGNVIDNFNLGLYYNNSLVALMTFSIGRKNINSNNLELLRYATDINYRIIGGFSKLLKHSVLYIKENYNNFNYIFTFADYSLSRGNVYLKNGFILDHYSKPSYYYVKNNKKINRYSMRKSKLKKDFPDFYNENLTELEIVNKIPNIYRIWNCGNLVFKYKI